MLSVFQFNTQSVRILVIDGEPWFVARDVFEVLSMAWAGSQSLDKIKTEWKMTQPMVDTLNRSQEAWVISESAVYKLAFRSNKLEAESFTDFVASDILPSIRKTGSYSPIEQPKQIMPTHAEALRGWADSLEQNALLTEKIAIDAPYTALGQVIEVAKGNLKVGEYAKIIGTGEKRLFVLLRDKGILSSNASNWNRPYQKYIDQGYFRCTEKVTQVGIKFVSLITPKGQVWLQKQLNNVVAMELA